jgi:hypothetical protein
MTKTRTMWQRIKGWLSCFVLGKQHTEAERYFEILRRAVVCADSGVAMRKMEELYQYSSKSPGYVVVSRYRRYLLVTLEDAKWLVEHGNYEYEII